VAPSTELVERLAEARLFAHCNTSDLHVVADRCEVRDVAAGTTLVREGEPGDEFFVLLDGQADVRRDGELLAQLGPGQSFGELALLDPGPRAADVVVTSDATIAVLGKARFRLVLEAVPAVSEAMLASLARLVRTDLALHEPARI
jgi:CRP/FNR family transcriptional regulator, cyclic AMP receptor protein